MMSKQSIDNRIYQFARPILAIFVGSLLITGCATSPAEKNVATTEDPYESVNRNIYSFNDNVDTYVAKPVATAYKWATPEIAQTGIYNFFSNLKDINVVINDLLQAKFNQSAQDAGRFLLNTTIGLGGLVDVAKDVGLEQHEENCEQTLATWGAPSGPYLVLPLAGPTTVLGLPCAVFDTATNPASWIGAPIQLIEVVDKRAKAQAEIDVVQESLDPYAFTRSGFLQRRDFLIRDGKGVAANDIENDISIDEGNTDKLAKPAAENKSTAPQQTAAAAPTSAGQGKYALHLSSDSFETGISESSPEQSFDKAAQSFNEQAQAFQNTPARKHRK